MFYILMALFFISKSGTHFRKRRRVGDMELRGIGKGIFCSFLAPQL
jgi:hypothetical protein